MKNDILSDEYLSSFFTELSLILGSGMSIGDGISMLSGGGAKLIAGISAALDEGQPLSAALDATRSFPDYSIKMIIVGEKTGRLEDTLRTLAAHYDSSDRLSRRIRAMVFYPGVLMLLMLAVIVVLLVKVLPVFDQVYRQLGTGLTGLAGGFLKLGGVLSSAMPAVLAILGVAVVFLFAVEFSAAARRRVLKLFSRGKSGVAAKTADARFASALSIGMSSGLPVEEAMELAIGAAGDSAGARKYSDCAAHLSSGAGIADALTQSGALPEKYSRMVEVGVRSGSGDTAMEEAARRMQLDAEESAERTLSRIEPAMVIFVCAVIGLIMLSVMLPLLDIMSVIG